MADRGQSAGPLYVYRCRYCGQPAPDEWGTGRRCPEHPRKGTVKPYMQECEFCPIPGVERDPALETVQKLREHLADIRDAMDGQRDLAQGVLDGSHNWVVANSPSDPSTILGFIPEADDAE